MKIKKKIKEIKNKTKKKNKRNSRKWILKKIYIQLLWISIDQIEVINIINQQLHFKKIKERKEKYHKFFWKSIFKRSEFHSYRGYRGRIEERRHRERKVGIDHGFRDGNLSTRPRLSWQRAMYVGSLPLW